MKADPNSSSTKNSVTEEPDSDEFDPNRFTVTRMPTDFLRWMLKHPLPKANPDDLWKDTLPPGMEVNREHLRDDEPARVERSSDGARHVKPVASARGPSHPGRSRRAVWIVGALALCSVVALGLAIFQTRDDALAPEPNAGARPAQPSEPATAERSAQSAAPKVNPAPSKEPRPKLTTEDRVDDKASNQAGSQPPPAAPDPKPERQSKAASPAPSPQPNPKTTSDGEFELIVGKQ